MTRDLTIDVQTVYAAKTLEGKKVAMLELIEHSVAKNATKVKARSELERIKTSTKVDFFATNYMLSGEGMKVR